MNIERQLGKRIRYLRKAKKMSIESLALEAEVNRNYLGDLERGLRNPTLKILAKIAMALEVSLDELFKGLQIL